jgi:trimeric autotransporter adhesin
MSRSSRTAKRTKLWHIASLTFFGSLTAACLLVAAAPLPARADNDQDSRHKHEDNDKGIRAEIAALQAQVADLQNQVNSLQASNTTLQNQLAMVQSNKALGLGPFVSVVSGLVDGVNGPHIYFTGANIHIVSGSGMTNDNLAPTGLGNLIIGYDEDPALFGRSPLNTGDRGGSHNLVIGSGHRFTKAAFGGLLAGELNTISNLAASVSGGLGNIASGGFASVSGGASNTASDGNGISFGATAPSVSGGLNNTAGGPFASVSGGENNTASGGGASVSGGLNNTATGKFNPADGTFVQAPSVSGGQNNTASGAGANVTGGTQNTAAGIGTVVIGGHNVTDNNNNSIAPNPPFP